MPVQATHKLSTEEPLEMVAEFVKPQLTIGLDDLAGPVLIRHVGSEYLALRIGFESQPRPLEAMDRLICRDHARSILIEEAENPSKLTRLDIYAVLPHEALVSHLLGEDAKERLRETTQETRNDDRHDRK